MSPQTLFCIFLSMHWELWFLCLSLLWLSELILGISGRPFRTFRVEFWSQVFLADFTVNDFEDLESRYVAFFSTFMSSIFRWTWFHLSIIVALCYRYTPYSCQTQPIRTVKIKFDAMVHCSGLSIEMILKHKGDFTLKKLQIVVKSLRMKPFRRLDWAGPMWN